MTSRSMALTPEHVSRAHRVVEDTGPEANVTLHSDADYETIVRDIIASRPQNQEIWLFAYGSLIWKPEVDHSESQVGVARGWHRSFCFKAPRFRGTREQPGLMMALDRGGQCRGVLYKLDSTDPEAMLAKLFRREFTVKPINSMPRWITVDGERGRLSALTFVMNRQSPLTWESYALMKLRTSSLRPVAIGDLVRSTCTTPFFICVKKAFTTATSGGFSNWWQNVSTLNAETAPSFVRPKVFK